MTSDFKRLISEIKEKWDDCLKNSPDIFRYVLNISKEKILEGKFNFLVQLNKDRATKRRKPEKFLSITPVFDSDKFNFTKIDKREILFERILLESKLNTSFIINNSPLTKYHILIVPNCDSCLAQIMTKDCLEIAFNIMTSTDDKSIKIGYNSPGALASVNHLHLHLLYIEHDLYVEDVELVQLVDNFYRIDNKKYPIEGFCMILRDVKNDVEKLYKVVQYCCDKVIPHNIFFTKSRDAKEIRIFFFPRQLNNFGENKIYSTHLNVAFCELSGFIPIGDDELYESITEEYVLRRFADEIGLICIDIENDLKNIVASN
ncbi:hypothetical protein PVAND_003931 [Polypedilum vanderplanki]|uniref:GDP-D-glucose phosphorylase 1 n=1 Tax=Polypedilum vanderplanki TaxID=319348 RepID=A0A9J6BW35_POLVA|nr:hypothetical protein PVAND_003931 [Polypedilum vanderplanki]